MVKCTRMHVGKNKQTNLQCGVSRSRRDQRSYPPSPGQHPSGVCWSQWRAGLPLCWDGHLAAMCMWSVHHLAQICMLFPLEKIRTEWKSKYNLWVVSSVPLLTTVCQQEPLAVNTKTLLTQQSLHWCCVYRALSVCNVSLCWVMTLQSTEQHITLEQLSVPSEGLSTIMSIHKCREIHWKLGRQVLAPLSS